MGVGGRQRMKDTERVFLKSWQRYWNFAMNIYIYIIIVIVWKCLNSPK